MVTGLLEPHLEFAFELRVEVGEPVRIGGEGGEDRNFTPITGGVVEGPRLRGRVVPGGGDWWITRGETTFLDARYLLEADDGATIDIVNRGYFWLADPGYGAAFEAREHIPEEALYYRTAPAFSTAAREHAWLGRHQFVGMARPGPDRVDIRVFVLR